MGWRWSVGDYAEFLDCKTHLGGEYGFSPETMPEWLFPFQAALVRWALNKGRAAIFADCGLGKTPMQLVWADAVHRHTGRPVLVLCPLAVSHQTVGEAHKFGIDAARSAAGERKAPIVVTNYERLEHFNPSDYSGVVCDESSILKNYDGATKAAVTEFCRKLPFRLLCTATAAPNDYIELGTSSEALGDMGHMDMLNYFFKNDQNTSDTKRHWASCGGGAPKWRFKRHAETRFWRWVCSWARAMRRPSDMGFPDDGFALPELVEAQTTVKASRPLNGYLFAVPAHGLKEQREERRATIRERCEEAAAKVDHDRVAVVWCHLNEEGDLLERIIPDARQVKGAMSDDQKEEVLGAFAAGQVRVLVIKPKIGGFGLNWQHCNHMTFFPSHSYEQYYQAVRRCWRFGQERPVTVDIITTEGEAEVLSNLKRKAAAADAMFSSLVSHMNAELGIRRYNPYTTEEEVPSWL